MKFVEIGNLSDTTNAKLDWIIHIMETRVVHKMTRGEDPKFDTNDFHAMSCVFNVPKSELRKIFKACWSIWTKQKTEDRL